MARSTLDREELDRDLTAYAESKLGLMQFSTLIRKALPWLTLGVNLTGGSLSILISAVGSEGFSSCSPFAQASFCGASALIWAALASTRLMVRSAARAEIVGCALCLVLLVESRAFALSDALVAVATWLVCLGVVLAQLALVAGKKGQEVDSLARE